MLLAIGGACFVAIAVAAHVLPLRLLEPEAWSSRLGPIALIVAASGVLGVVLLVLALVEAARPKPRGSLPPAAVLPRPEGDPGSWGIADVASELARQLRGTQRTVHLEGDRIEVQWEDEGLAIHRCELVDIGYRVLQHSDSIETKGARSQREDGVVSWEGRGPRRSGTRLGHDYRTSRHNAVHRVVDAALETASWRRQG